MKRYVRQGEPLKTVYPVVRLEHHYDRCDDCGACDEHYHGIREVARIHALVGITLAEWEIIEPLVLPAVEACPNEALEFDDRGLWI